ncbi:MAG TPA: myxococcus cysteine-rich repeat containing protein [Candidatus Binatia bacterium]|nr:myxococcus cysteine-rich repeat containing protein [Candidatus Binatia bacterium]
MAFTAIASTVAFSRPAWSSGIFASSYSAGMVFQDALNSTTMTLAFDGTSFWSSSGGSVSGVRYAQYAANGALVATYSPGLDFRSVFTSFNSSTVYARQFNDPTIFVQTAPGTFAPQLTLTGGTLDWQSAVGFAAGGSEMVAMNEGVVTRWNAATGNVIGTTTLAGFGSQNDENTYPQNRGVAAAGGYYLTYSKGVLSAWDASGARVGDTTLTAAGQTFDAHFSLSYANGKVWIVDQAGASWRGYDVGLGSGGCGRVAVLGAPNSTSWNDDVQAKLLGAGGFSVVDTFYLPSGVPTLAQMQTYQALLVYSDGPLDPGTATTLGDRLADYVDGGGGVVAAVFATASIPIQGRFNADDYWAIRPSGQQQNDEQVLGTVFVPGHPILAGVTSFDGGTASYRPSLDNLHPSAVRVANWTGPGNIPLIATRDIAGVRRADLGFFPPSTDARSDFWNASTDGDLILANALAYVCSVPSGLCGNGQLDPGEQCDDGNTASGDCCSATCHFEAAGSSCPDDGDACTTEQCDGAGTCQHAALPDSDGDLVCDQQDRCTNVGGARKFYANKPKPRVVVSKINADPTPGNDGLKISAAFDLPSAGAFAALNPSLRGARIVLLDQAGGVELDQTLPGGPYGGNGTRGWKRNGIGTSWQYRDKTLSPLGGVTGLKIDDRSLVSPRQVRVTVSAKNGTYPITAGDAPLEAIVVLGDQTDAEAGLCGESEFTPANCAFNGAQTTLTCKK